MISLLIGPSNELQIDATTSGTAISTAVNYRTLLFDGNTHTISVTWSNAAGAWAVYVDGVLRDSGSGVFSGSKRCYGRSVRIRARTRHRRWRLQLNAILPAAHFTMLGYSVQLATPIKSLLAITAIFLEPKQVLVANWKFDNLSEAGVITEAVSGNNLSVRNIVATGFTSSTPTLSLQLDENSVTGTRVGEVHGIDMEREAKIASILASDTSIRYSAETGKFYKLGSATTSSFATAQSEALANTLGGINGQMVTIRSASENAIVSSIANSLGGYVWLGASDAAIEGNWQWFSGSQNSDTFWQGVSTGYNTGAYSNWDPAEPQGSAANEDYVVINPSNSKWYDTPSAIGFVLTEWNADTVLDATNAITYSIQSQSVTGAFAINSSTGVITVADSTKLDFETQASHTVNVRLTDGSGATYDKAFTVAMNNLAEDNAAPTDLSTGTSEHGRWK